MHLWTKFKPMIMMVPFFKPIIQKIDPIGGSNANSMQLQHGHANNTDACADNADTNNESNEANEANEANPVH
jgi:hypothetical protein